MKKELKIPKNSLQFSLFSFFSILILIISIFGNLLLAQALSLIFLLLLGTLLFTRPFLGLMALIFLRPALDLLGTKTILELKSLAIFSFNLNSLLGILAVIWAGLIFFRNKSRFHHLPALYLISIFIALSFLSLFWTPQLSLGLREFFRLLSIFAIYLGSFFLIRNKKDLKRLIYIIISSSFIPITVAFWQYFTGRGEIIFGEFFRRAYGSFYYPNSLAFFLVLILGLALLKLYQEKKMSLKIISAAFIFLCFLALLATYTRGAWMGAVIVFLIFGALKLRRALLLGLLILVLVYVLGPVFQERIRDVISLEPFGSLVWRFRLWKSMLPFFSEKPLLGYGLSSFQVLSQKLQGLSALAPPEAHNDYLKLLIELGGVGLMLYLLVQLRLFVFFLKNYFRSKDKDLREVSLITALILASFLIMAFGDNILRGTATQWALFSLFGGTAYLTTKTTAGNRKE